MEISRYSIQIIETYTLLILIIFSFRGFAQPEQAPFVCVLGIAQDGGYPQAGCTKACCESAWHDKSRQRFVSCLGIVDPQSRERWLIDATPDFPDQLRLLDRLFPLDTSPGLSGILLTHGHIGHYTGLIHLGREVMGTNDVPVYALPRMIEYLQTNGPCNLLIRLKQIRLIELADKQEMKLNERITVTPLQVPHRGEYTETVGFIITGPSRSVLYIPDIDKWSHWDNDIESNIERVDIAYLDATFFDGSELPGRDMSEIPHPFIIESISYFDKLEPSEKSKIRFIHLNHTNPALNVSSDAHRTIVNSGFNVAMQEEEFRL